jgi:hypothetical protein
VHAISTSSQPQQTTRTSRSDYGFYYATTHIPFVNPCPVCEICNEALKKRTESDRMTGGTQQEPVAAMNGSDNVSVSTSSIHNVVSSSSGLHMDHRLIDEVDEFEENRSLRTRTIQIVITESWMEGIHALWEETRDFFVDLLASVLHLICMDPDTLLLFSTILLILDCIISFLSGVMENLLARTVMRPERKLILVERIESLLTGASWGLHIQGVGATNGDGTGIDSYTNMSNFASWIPWNLGCSDDDFGCSDVFGLSTVVMAVLVAVCINTSYFTTLMAPLYSRLLDSHNLSTEVLLGLLLLLFGLETITALSFILLGYKLLSTHMTGSHLEENNDSITTGDPNVHNSSFLGMRGEANLLLVLATLLWLACVVTSKVVRMALYHSIGD